MYTTSLVEVFPSADNVKIFKRGLDKSSLLYYNKDTKKERGNK